LPAVLNQGQRRWGFTAGSGRQPRGSRQGIKPPGQLRVLGDHGLDLRRIAGVEVVAKGAQFALLGLDLGHAGGIGVCSVQRLGRRFGPVGEKCAQNVLRDFEADALGEGGWHHHPAASNLSR